MPQLQPPKFPPIPEFYGGQIGPQFSPETATNQTDWSAQYRKSIPSKQPLLDVLMDIANDPRNAWIGLGPLAGAVKGARLIKPLVAADQMSYRGLLPAKQKSLKWSGSEQAAKILDYDPQLGHTVNPVWGGPNINTESFAHNLGGGPPPTPDEIVAAQDILKKIAQQNALPTVTLYRGGEPLRHAGALSKEAAVRTPNTPVPVTSDIKTATEFAHAGGPHVTPLFELQVPREDLLANIEKLQRGRGYRESEYLVPLRAFQNAQTRLPFENPDRFSGNKFEGAQIKEAIQGGPWSGSTQQPMKYGKGGSAEMGYAWGHYGPQNILTHPDYEGHIAPLPNGKYAVEIPGLQTELYSTLPEAATAHKGANLLIKAFHD